MPGIIDLDEIAALAPIRPDSAPESTGEVATLVDSMDRLLKRCRLEGIKIRLTLKRDEQQYRDVDLTRLGLKSDRYVVVPVHMESLKAQAALAGSDPGLALFLAMDALTKESPMLEPFRTSILLKAARLAVEMRP